MTDDRRRVIPSMIGMLHDVDTSTTAPTDGDTLVWDGTAKKWTPAAASAPTDDWAHDVFVIAATPLTTYQLTFIPKDLAVIVAKGPANGLHLLSEGIDYTVDYTTGVITVSASQTAGDLIDCRYVAVGINHVTFTYTGAVQTWTVPAGVTSATMDCYAAQGFPSAPGATDAHAGMGGRIRAVFSVTPGEVLDVNVGGTPISGGGVGWNGGGAGGNYTTPGGGGGGASDVRRTPYALGDRLIVAGGGGGGGGHSGGTGTGTGGAGGYTSGADGAGSFPGLGATSSAGGAAGGAGSTAGSSGQGGNAGTGGSGVGGGGGGGGYFGGGAAESDTSANCSGGGGGSSAAPGGGTSLYHENGVRPGNGLIVISWQS